MELTQRQIQILKCITEEFIETAEPVGSQTLEKKYNLGISPATVRNEMSALTQMGYLRKAHSSAGRAPTSLGLKYFVKNLMTPKNMSIAEEVGVKQKVWSYRNEFDKLIKESTRELANRTRSMAVSTVGSEDLFAYGASNLLEEPEFFDIDVTKTLLSLMDNVNFWFDLIRKAGIDLSSSAPITGQVHFLIGEDLGMEHLEPCGFVYQTYRSGQNTGIIGVVGPARCQYPRIVPVVDYVADLISKITI